jgi:hypothetical protein
MFLNPLDAAEQAAGFRGMYVDVGDIVAGKNSCRAECSGIGA